MAEMLRPKPKPCWKYAHGCRCNLCMAHEAARLDEWLNQRAARRLRPIASDIATYKQSRPFNPAEGTDGSNHEGA